MVTVVMTKALQIAHGSPRQKPYGELFSNSLQVATSQLVWTLYTKVECWIPRGLHVPEDFTWTSNRKERQRFYYKGQRGSFGRPVSIFRKTSPQFSETTGADIPFRPTLKYSRLSQRFFQSWFRFGFSARTDITKSLLFISIPLLPKIDGHEK